MLRDPDDEGRHNHPHEEASHRRRRASPPASSARRSSAAPQNESIRQEDLRADLFFLAGDSLRGRLTDTEENRAAADFIRSRFERMGLKAAGPNGSYFQPYNLMTATLGDGATACEIAGVADGARGSCALGQEFYPHRFSASGTRDRHRSCSPASASARRTCSYDDYTGDVQRQDRARARSRAGRARPEQPVRRRRHVGAVDGVAQGAGRAGEGRGRACCSSATCTTIPARRTSRRRRATTGRRSRRAS